MSPKKAHILYIEKPVSLEYRGTAAESCLDVGLSFEYTRGWMFSKPKISAVVSSSALQIINPTNDFRKDQDTLWDNVSQQLGRKIFCRHYMDRAAACATAGHMLIWDKIAKEGEPAVVLEHDAIMIHPPTIDIPDNQIVALGYKRKDPQSYDHETAGPPKELVSLSRHAGAHAYAITPNTAKTLLDEVSQFGVTEAIDNRYFMRDKSGSAISDVPLSITNPICALGWLRKSTIWAQSCEHNYQALYVSSYVQNTKNL